MSMSIIAMLLSLAMMLTGAGGEGMPAQSARTLVLRNAAFTYNGETVRLAPQARIGASTDGESAVFDFGVQLGDKTLLPVQIGAGEKGLTALFKESGVAVNVTSEALDNLIAQQGAPVEVENPELLKFITDEYLPAYTGLINAISDKDFQASLKAKSDALLEGIVDRGEGTPDTVVIDDISYDVLNYHYAIETEQMGALADAAYDLAPELSAYRDAMLKLYDMMPEESGLKGITSISEVMDRFGMQMRMDVDEQRTEDGAVQVMDAVLTLDLSGVPAAMAENGMLTEQAEEVPAPVEDVETTGDVVAEPAQTPEPVELKPVVMDIHSITVDDAGTGSISFGYEMNGDAVDFNMSFAQEPTSASVDLGMDISQGGEKIGRISFSGVEASNAESGSQSYGVSYDMVIRDALQLDAGAFGEIAGDGTSNNTVNLEGRTPEATFALSFDLDVVGDPIEDVANAAEPAIVIDDLSLEALDTLMQDQSFAAVMMKVGGSLSMDASALTNDESIKNAITLLSGERLPIVVEDVPQENYDYTYQVEGDDGLVIEGLDGDIEGDYEPAEDDGELGFETPELTYLPQGWTVTKVETDTAYDWVGISVGDENGAEAMYATFFKDMDGEISNYIVNEKGTLQEGRAMGVSDFGEGGMAVTLRENGLYGNLSFVSDAIDVDTLGRIVAGIQF